ncbi:hypothetical protein CRE_10440 [Caenorhabditis remanei]|uniref:Uncharacterized protein n=1 Tax=Caenorhabditis remanei TaxID=31234 RepID=E3N0W2_CAERE|nr:hypothetical protein CRE_10440 [Caenorhabditis remanei]
MTEAQSSHLETMKKLICLHQAQLAEAVMSMKDTKLRGIGQHDWRALRDMQTTDLLLENYKSMDNAMNKIIRLVSGEEETQQQQDKHFKEEIRKFVSGTGFSALMESAGKTYEEMNSMIQSISTEEERWIREKLDVYQATIKPGKDIFKEVVLWIGSSKAADTKIFVAQAIKETAKIIGTKRIPLAGPDRCVICYKEGHTKDRCSDTTIENIKRTMLSWMRLRCLQTDHTKAIHNVEMYLERFKPWNIIPCRYCEDSTHSAESCGIPVDAKQMAVIVKKMCNQCLSDKHASKYCNQTIGCKYCKQAHYYRHCDQAPTTPEPNEQSSESQTRGKVREPEMKSGDQTATKQQTTKTEMTGGIVQSERQGNDKTERPVVKLTELTLNDSTAGRHPYMVVTWFTHEHGLQNLEAYIHHHQHDLNTMRKLFSITKMKRNGTISEDFDTCMIQITQNLKEMIEEIGGSPTDVVIVHQIPRGQTNTPKNRDLIHTELQGIQRWMWKWSRVPDHRNREGCKFNFAKKIAQRWIKANEKKAAKEQEKNSKSAGAKGQRCRGPQQIRSTCNKSDGQSTSQRRNDNWQRNHDQVGPQQSTSFLSVDFPAPRVSWIYTQDISPTFM